MTIKAEYLVVDSEGFSKNVPLHELATNLFTLSEVVRELRDKETRQRMEVMPFDMNYKQPSVESVKKISDFARKTGDYASLSEVDIRVLAVTLDLEVEMVGTSHLRSEPFIKKTTEFYPRVDTEKLNKADAKLPGFFMVEGHEGGSLEKSESFDQFNYWREPMLDLEDLALEDLAESTMNRSETDEEDKDDGWITPGNVKNKKAINAGTDEGKVDQKVTVACMTTDLAMQNVCKQLGLNIIGTNGMVIKETENWILPDKEDQSEDDDYGSITLGNVNKNKEAGTDEGKVDQKVTVACKTTDFAMKETKNWILRCYECFKTTPLMDQEFCPTCGNKTLKRVSVTVNADGSQQIHISTRRPLSFKGKKFSLSAPKGGKHGVNPKLVAETQQRLSKKALQSYNSIGGGTGGTPMQ